MLRKLFGRKEKPINSYQDFWNWFVNNERKFFKAINNHQNIEADFFDKISPKLEELKEGFYFLAGMLKDEIAELVITPDGNVANIVFVEELIDAAPKLPNWKFTALKPELDIKNVGITMGGYRYTKEIDGIKNFYVTCS